VGESFPTEMDVGKRKDSQGGRGGTVSTSRKMA